MSIRDMIIYNMRKASLTKTGRLRKTLPRFTMTEIDDMVLEHVYNDDNLSSPEFHSVRARISELTAQGLLVRENGKYTLNPWSQLPGTVVA